MDSNNNNSSSEDDDNNGNINIWNGNGHSSKWSQTLSRILNSVDDVTFHVVDVIKKNKNKKKKENTKKPAKEIIKEGK